MEFGGWQSGFGAAWADLREFLAAIRWSRPGLLWLSAAPVLLALLEWWAARRNSAFAARLGRSNSIRDLGTITARRRIWGRVAFGFAWTAFALAVAGPLWGESGDGGVAVGRDVVVVIDLSRSMLAEDLATPQARWRAAVEATRDLVEAASRRGGHRIGVVIFAARPMVLVPLTTDYDHVLQMLDELDAEVQPGDIRPANEFAKSGTRIGAALTLATQTHDARYPGKQDIVLLSDGDDPVADREWSEGIPAARTAGIPIHVVGIGNAAESQFLLKSRRRGEGEWIATRLVEEPLVSIAEGTRGTYLASGRGTPHLGHFFETQLQPLPSRELTDDPARSERDRSTVFWLLGMVALLLGWLGRR